MTEMIDVKSLARSLELQVLLYVALNRTNALATLLPTTNNKVTSSASQRNLKDEGKDVIVVEASETDT
ncbi:nonribosomal peptide synthase GliP2 [Penicillium taxi]|uniref:nonribosomal peptide synthase GliP2 n=1 Tax=Penicillium taxi TaxID=168475 RepID=UPI002545B095|nr:nonribosomal peptide synthase GliP2 [Penicillium taxi]KAJ5885524.1 nonribosomal peptide synthase GliP2 [Penicillium taxi]